MSGGNRDPEGEDPSPGASEDLAGALHEVSNALTVIISWIGSARSSLVDDPAYDVAQAFDVIAARAKVAHGIARRAIGAEGYSDEPRGAASIVRDTLTGLLPQAQDKRVELINATSTTIESDVLDNADRVVQVLTNLMLNAVAMSPVGGKVTLEGTRHNDGCVLLAVQDEGPGIPAHRREQLFSSGASTRAGGAGIGLRHAAELAQSAGGTLSLGACTVGARFELLWPVYRPEVAPVSLPPARSHSLEGAKILIVEDDEAVSELLGTALGARGASVHNVASADAIPAALLHGPYDAVLFDMSPIADDVRGAFEQVRRDSPNARLVVISGSAAALPTLPEELQPAWVRKPFEIGEVVDALLSGGLSIGA